MNACAGQLVGLHQLAVGPDSRDLVWLGPLQVVAGRAARKLEVAAKEASSDRPDGWRQVCRPRQTGGGGCLRGQVDWACRGHCRNVTSHIPAKRFVVNQFEICHVFKTQHKSRGHKKVSKYQMWMASGPNQKLDHVDLSEGYSHCLGTDWLGPVVVVQSVTTALPLPLLTTRHC